MGLSPSIINDVVSLDQSTFYILTAGITMIKRNVRTNRFGFEYSVYKIEK